VRLGSADWHVVIVGGGAELEGTFPILFVPFRKTTTARSWGITLEADVLLALMTFESCYHRCWQMKANAHAQHYREARST
jgi:hypothetical protein